MIHSPGIVRPPLSCRDRWSRAKVRTEQTTTGHRCSAVAADPDERLAREPQSLAEDQQRPPRVNQVLPAQVQAFAHQRKWSRGGGFKRRGTCERSAISRTGSVWQRELVASGQNRPGHPSILGGHRDYRLPVSATLLQGYRPARDRVVLLGGSREHRSCAQDQQRSEIGITSLGDSAQTSLAARTVLSWYQAKPSGQLAAIPPRWPVQIPPPVATPNSPRQDRPDYDDSVLMAMREAAALRR